LQLALIAGGSLAIGFEIDHHPTVVLHEREVDDALDQPATLQLQVKWQFPMADWGGAGAFEQRMPPGRFDGGRGFGNLASVVESEKARVHQGQCPNLIRRAFEIQIA